ncbi:hypothetical protein CHARACLAT_024846 [Characodon lateralis]|uniref:Uncharacterized protein n=1 Tax=Characodon lateralis TaxID=208331 RepID=A0ABU7DTY4_9TELE|nr:hypothetical protein [Characodon lateralis]
MNIENPQGCLEKDSLAKLPCNLSRGDPTSGLFSHFAYKAFINIQIFMSCKMEGVTENCKPTGYHRWTRWESINHRSSYEAQGNWRSCRDPQFMWEYLSKGQLLIMHPTNLSYLEEWQEEKNCIYKKSCLQFAILVTLGTANMEEGALVR